MADADSRQHVAPSEVQIRLLLDGIQDYAIFLLDREGYVRSWNAGAERIKGYAASEITGRHFSVFYTEPDLQNDRPERLLDIARREGSVEHEGWRVRKDGSRFWANVLITALRDPESQEVVGFAKVTRDITERRLAEDALHESEERFRLLVESVRDYAIYMLSPEGVVISWNAGARRIKGYTAEEILGRHFSTFYVPEEVASGKPQLELETALTEGRYEEEGWRQRKDGSRFWANVVLTPIRDQQGSLLGFAKVTRDMTERRRARDELAAARDRTRKLALSNSEKDEFLGFVAHELKNPLTIIEGMARLLHTREHELDVEERKEAIEALAEESTRMRELVENLLALATPTNTIVKFERDLREALLATVANIERIYPERAILMNLVDATVPIEPSLFDRIVSNLLDNACKYSPPEMPVALEARLTETEVVIDVLDRGPGVDATELGLIFESFYRSPRQAGAAKGKGLGLAVCKRLAEQLGGSIDAALRDGGGMRMRFMLPVQSPETE